MKYSNKRANLELLIEQNIDGSKFDRKASEGLIRMKLRALCFLFLNKVTDTAGRLNVEFVSSRNVSHNRERPKKAWFSTNKYINLVRNLLV